MSLHIINLGVQIIHTKFSLAIIYFYTIILLKLRDFLLAIFALTFIIKILKRCFLSHFMTEEKI